MKLGFWKKLGSAEPSIRKLVMAGRVIDRGDTGSDEPGASNREGVKVAFGASWALQSPGSQKVIIMGCISHMWELDQTLNGPHSFLVFGRGHIK